MTLTIDDALLFLALLLAIVSAAGTLFEVADKRRRDWRGRSGSRSARRSDGRRSGR